MSATATIARPPEPLALAATPEAAADAAVATPPPPDPLAAARSAWNERMRLPLVSDDARLVARSPGVDPNDGSRVILLKVVDVDSGRDQHVISVRTHDPPDVELARIAQAAAVVDERTWTPLAVYPTSVDTSVPERHNGLGSSQAMEGTGEGLVVQFLEPTLTVREVGGATLFRRAFPGWSERQRGCAFFTDLMELWGSRSLGVLLVTLDHSGSPHFCEAQPDTRTVRFAVRAR
jgi:hypothetical protein